MDRKSLQQHVKIHGKGKKTFCRNNVNCFAFLCQLTCQSADIMESLCGVHVRVRICVNNFSSKTTRPRDMLFSTSYFQVLTVE